MPINHFNPYSLNQIVKAIFIGILFLNIVACGKPNTKSKAASEINLKSEPPSERSKVETKTTDTTNEQEETSKPNQESQLEIGSLPTYSWLKNYSIENSILRRIPSPKGYERKTLDSNGFAYWLRLLPLKPAGTKVYLYNKSLKGNQGAHYGVVDLDVDPVDLQQCADAVMRLKAEFHYSQKAYDKIHFNYTSGDRVGFDDWSKGKQPRVAGNKVTFINTGQKGSTYQNFKKYLTQIFNYAGTASLSREMQQVGLKDISAGDVFIKGGHPGHAVIVLDVVENEAGAKQFLIGQSYMPAQDFHILKNPASSSPWYSNQFDGELVTPEWTFSAADLKRF